MNFNDLEPEPEDFPDPKRDRAQATAWARDLIERDDWLILDSETTGLEGRLIEIALVRPDGSTLFESLVNPKIHIPNSHLHGITDEMVKDAPDFAAIEPQLRELLHKDPRQTVVVYNAEFDAGILRRELIHLCSTRLGLGSEPSLACSEQELAFYRQWLQGHNEAVRLADEWSEVVSWKCAMLAYAAYIGEWSWRHQNYRYQALGGGHRAAGDCRACLDRIRQMAHALDGDPGVPSPDEDEDETITRPGRAKSSPAVCPRCQHADGWNEIDGYCMRCHDWVKA